MFKASTVARQCSGPIPSVDALTVEVRVESQERTVRESTSMTLPDDALPIEVRLEADAISSRLFPTLDQRPKIGRFTVLRTLGKGGMGVVFAAYDDVLDRKVAVKLLRTNPADAQATLRLLREAQALARLSHPNVVQVHEVGEHQGAVFVAMEFVAGATLRARLADERRRVRSWRETLELLIQAGRGLEAAHDAGLVHRDFKPDNVIVGDDGRVRVLDFGLVRGLGSRPAAAGSERTDEGDLEATAAEGDSEPTSFDESRALLQRSLTARGTIMGTPAYMAPEQHRGEPCDALADQFAFCVVAFEALFDRRPFVGRTWAALTAAVLEGEITPVPSEAEVPKRVREAIVRGLSLARDQRWPSMAVLLDELGRTLVRKRRRAAGLVVGGALGAALAGVGTWAMLDGEPRLCAVDQTQLDGAWDDERRAAVRDAFAATGLPFADETLSVVEASLDDWTARWLDGLRDACEATHVEGTQSPGLLDLRKSCLERKRRELSALTEVLAAADEIQVMHVPELLARLPDLGACRDAASVADPVPLPADPRRRDAIEAAEDDIVRASALMLTGKIEAADALAHELRPRVEALDYARLSIELGGLEGELLVGRASMDAGIAELLDAARAAERHRLDDLSATLRTRAAWEVAGVWSRPERERELLADAEAAVGRIGRPDDPRVIDLWNASGRLDCQAGQHERALDHFRRARARAVQLGARQRAHRQAVDIANDEAHLNHHQRAQAEYEGALADARANFGDGSLLVAAIEFDLGLLAIDRGEPERATAHLDRAGQIYVEALGPNTINAARVRLARTDLALSSGEFERAKIEFEGVSDVFVRELGPDHKETGEAWMALGNIRYYYDQDYEGSIVAYERALDIVGSALGDDHEQLAVAHSNIGEALVKLGEFEAALPRFERAIAVFGRSLPPDHPYFAYPLKGRGLALLGLGRPAEAVLDLERALELHERSGADPVEQAELRFGLARALAEDAPGRSIALAEQAAEEFRALDNPDRVTAIETWSRSNHHRKRKHN